MQKFKGSTIYEFWNDIEEGDSLSISLQILRVGKSTNGAKAPKVNITNLTAIKNNRMHTKFVCNINSANQYLSKLKFEEK